MLEQIFGGEVPTAVRFVIAFGVVLALIAITFVALRKFAGRKLPLSNAGRARQPRLGVLDAFAIDSRRRLVLIRRDNVEHLIMIGGPNDVLVESEIVRNPAQAGLTAPAAVAAPRVQPRVGEAVRAPVGAPPPTPIPPQRPLPFHNDAPPADESAAETPSRFRMPFQRERATSSGAAAAPSAPAPAPARVTPPRVRAPEPAQEPKTEEPAAPPAPTPAPASSRPKPDVDPLYADIERKLGEALARPPSTPAARPAPPPPPARRAEPAEAAPAPQSSQKSHLDALEEEMASLLGRERP